MADIPKTSIFVIIWHLGGSRCVQNTPTRSGNDLPMHLRTHIFDKKNVFLYTIRQRCLFRFV